MMLLVSTFLGLDSRSNLGSRCQLCFDQWTYDNSSSIGVNEFLAFGVDTKFSRF
jgi:hypothetical protein